MLQHDVDINAPDSKKPQSELAGRSLTHCYAKIPKWFQTTKPNRELMCLYRARVGYFLTLNRHGHVYTRSMIYSV